MRFVRRGKFLVFRKMRGGVELVGRYWITEIGNRVAAAGDEIGEIRGGPIRRRLQAARPQVIKVTLRQAQGKSSAAATLDLLVKERVGNGRFPFSRAIAHVDPGLLPLCFLQEQLFGYCLVGWDWEVKSRLGFCFWEVCRVWSRGGLAGFVKSANSTLTPARSLSRERGHIRMGGMRGARSIRGVRARGDWVYYAASCFGYARGLNLLG